MSDLDKTEVDLMEAEIAQAEAERAHDEARRALLQAQAAYLLARGWAARGGVFQPPEDRKGLPWVCGTRRIFRGPHEAVFMERRHGRAS